jgi:hypothetical protein
MIKPVLFFCCVTLASSANVQLSLGQDAGLYANAIDPTKAYVRVHVIDPDQASIGREAVAVPAEGVSGYVSVPAGSIEIGSGEKAADMTVEAGTYYTFAQNADGFVQFADPAIADPSKAEVLFYNLTDTANVNLFVPAAKTNAITAVNAGTSQSVELRAPLTLSFEAQADGATLASVSDVALERKQAISLFLNPTADGAELVQVINSFADAN